MKFTIFWQHMINFKNCVNLVCESEFTRKSFIPTTNWLIFAPNTKSYTYVEVKIILDFTSTWSQSTFVNSLVMSPNAWIRLKTDALTDALFMAVWHLFERTLYKQVWIMKARCRSTSKLIVQNNEQLDYIYDKLSSIKH